MDEDRYMPLGFAFQMATNENSMMNFANLTKEEKDDVIEKAKQAKSKEAMKSIVDGLGNSNGKYLENGQFHGKPEDNVQD